MVRRQTDRIRCKHTCMNIYIYIYIYIYSHTYMYRMSKCMHATADVCWSVYLCRGNKVGTKCIQFNLPLVHNAQCSARLPEVTVQKCTRNQSVVIGSLSIQDSVRTVHATQVWLFFGTVNVRIDTHTHIWTEIPKLWLVLPYHLK